MAAAQGMLRRSSSGSSLQGEEEVLGPAVERSPLCRQRSLPAHKRCSRTPCSLLTAPSKRGLLGKCAISSASTSSSCSTSKKRPSFWQRLPALFSLKPRPKPRALTFDDVTVRDDVTAGDVNIPNDISKSGLDAARHREVRVKDEDGVSVIALQMCATPVVTGRRCLGNTDATFLVPTKDGSEKGRLCALKKPPRKNLMGNKGDAITLGKPTPGRTLPPSGENKAPSKTDRRDPVPDMKKKPLHSGQLSSGQAEVVVSRAEPGRTGATTMPERSRDIQTTQPALARDGTCRDGVRHLYSSSDESDSDSWLDGCSSTARPLLGVTGPPSRLPPQRSALSEPRPLRPRLLGLLPRPRPSVARQLASVRLPSLIPSPSTRPPGPSPSAHHPGPSPSRSSGYESLEASTSSSECSVEGRTQLSMDFRSDRKRAGKPDMRTPQASRLATPGGVSVAELRGVASSQARASLTWPDLDSSTSSSSSNESLLAWGTPRAADFDDDEDYIYHPASRPSSTRRRHGNLRDVRAREGSRGKRHSPEGQSPGRLAGGLVERGRDEEEVWPRLENADSYRPHTLDTQSELEKGVPFMESFLGAETDMQKKYNGNLAKFRQRKVCRFLSKEFESPQQHEPTATRVQGGWIQGKQFYKEETESSSELLSLDSSMEDSTPGGASSDLDRKGERSPLGVVMTTRGTEGAGVQDTRAMEESGVEAALRLWRERLQRLINAEINGVTLDLEELERQVSKVKVMDTDPGSSSHAIHATGSAIPYQNFPSYSKDVESDFKPMTSDWVKDGAEVLSSGECREERLTGKSDDEASSVRCIL